MLNETEVFLFYCGLFGTFKMLLITYANYDRMAFD